MSSSFNNHFAKKKQALLLLTFFISFMLSAQVKPLDINLEDYSYPFPVRYIRVDAQKQQCRMAYMDVRPVKGNGQVIVRLHDKHFNGAYWRQAADTLSAKGYRVIIPDQ